MSILQRFKDIMSSNIHALLDKAEDPEKMIDQYMRNLNRDLGKVKAETASIMAAEKRAKRELDECQKEIDDMERYAVKALKAGNEADARKFLEKKAELSNKLTELDAAYQVAASNSGQMKQMHDKLVSDIDALESRRKMIKGKAALAKTQKRVNEMTSSIGGAGRSVNAFNRMEDKVNQMLDEANAMAELNAGAKDDIKDLAAKYENDVQVDDELEKLKAKIGESSVDDELEALKKQLEDKE